MDRHLVQVYRTAEDYRRYAPDNPDRLKSLAGLYQRYRRYFGRSVLDLGCGGGALSVVLAPTRRTYLGIDGNPDMIRQARKALAADSSHRFRFGDIRRSRITGRFDTVTLLGNSMAHLNASDMDELLRRRAANVHPGSTFIVDYRDLVAMFWNGTWSKVKVETLGRGKVVHRATKLDQVTGSLHMRARPSTGGWTIDWEHAIWSPFVMESLMRSHGWRLVTRDALNARSAKLPPEHWLDVYRLKAALR